MEVEGHGSGEAPEGCLGRRASGSIGRNGVAEIVAYDRCVRFPNFHKRMDFHTYSVFAN